MPTYLDRYHNGEHEQVWAELLALGEGVRSASAYLACRQIADVAGQPRFQRQTVVVQNQLGETTLSVRRPRMLCTPSTLS